MPCGLSHVRGRLLRSNKETLPERLKASDIRYKHLPRLGGLRHPQSGSPNTGWRISSFRGFADYMQTRVFDTSIGSLINLARKNRTMIICAEALPRRCHRSLIGDALLLREVEVYRIMSPTTLRAHTITDFAKVRGSRITYPGSD